MDPGSVLRSCVFIAAFAFIASICAAAEGPVIVVTGTGTAEAQPDRVTIDFTVLSRAKSAAEASAASAVETRPILAALRRLGVPDSAATSAGFGVQPPWDVRRGMRKEDTKESIATHRIRVRVREIATAGAIVESILDSGADRVEAVSFTVSDLDSARQSALTQAVEEARGDAQVMARAAGGELGPLIEVTTQGTAAPPRTIEYSNLVTAAGGPNPPSITPGPSIVRVVVLARWAFAERK